MKIRSFILYALCLLNVELPAQINSINDGNERFMKEQIREQIEDVEHCGTDERHTFLMNHDSEYAKQYLRHQSLLDSVLSNPRYNRSSQPPQYTIPVVVHVIHLGEAVGSGSNISDTQVQGAITGLNQRFANMNGQGLNIEIDFCIASRDPEGCPTSGIIRVNGSGVPLYTSEGVEFNNNCGAEETAVKDLSKWSTLDYYNIWVVHNICGDWSGYASYPNGGAYDGTVIDRNSMTSTSWTLSHELGHGLNLRHTFNGDSDGNSCPSNNNCSTEGDFVCDTPPHKRGDCGSSNPCSSSGIWNNSRYNWMSYCNSLNSVGRFTSDQKTRMRAAMEVFPREELQNSLGCDGPETPIITSSNAPMCSGTTRALTGTPAGGTFTVLSGPGSISGTTLTATGAGTIVIRYTTCAGNATQNITSYQTPFPSITSLNSPMCSGSNRTLTGTPTGGLFSMVSGPGTVSGNVLTATGAGTIIIQYVVTQNGCTGTTTQSITSNQTPTPVITSSNAPICSGETRTLTATPTGGNFSIVSGPGSISNNILTSNGIGTIVIQYTVTQYNCTASTTQSIISNLTPSPVINSSSAPMCSGDMRTLMGTPTGGVFSVISGPGSISGNILTANAGGTIVIQYAVTQSGCTGFAMQSITSIQTPSPVFTSSSDPMCSGQSRSLTATPAGGTFQIISGPGTISGNQLTATGAGTISIQYTVTQNNCTGSASQQITSHQTPEPQITSDASPMCSEEIRTLTAAPTGGDFELVSGPGAINGAILTATGQGIIIIQYEISINGCVGSTTQSITSFQTPEPEFTSEDDPMCSGETRLIFADPPGGSYDIISGPGTLNGQTLTAIDEGIIFLQYEFIQNGCPGIATQNIPSYETPDPEFISENGAMCSGESRVLIAIPSGGSFEVLSGPGTLSGNTLTVTGAGTILVEYYVSENNCDGSVTQQISTFLTPDPQITSVNSPMCEGESRTLSATPQGGEFEMISGPGNINGNTLTATGDGLIEFQYSYTQNICTGIASQEIAGHATPEPQITADLSSICSEESRLLTAVPTDGEFILVAGPATLNGNMVTSTGQGTIWIEYILIQNGCTGNDEAMINSFLTPETEILSATTPMCQGDARTLLGFPSGGTFTILSGPGSISGNVLTAVGVGTIAIKYAYSENTCEGVAFQDIISFSLPIALITSSEESICSGEIRPLTAIPSGGTFNVISGPGTINGQHLEAVSAGEITIEYMVEVNGCSGVSTQTITAVLTPDVSITSDDAPMCFDDTRILTGVPSDGTFKVISGPGQLSGNVLTPSGSGIIIIQYSKTDNGCTGIDIMEIGVSIGEAPMILSSDEPVCTGQERLLVGSPVGGQFVVVSGPGAINNNLLKATNSGSIEIEYRTCAGAESQTIEAKLSPVAEIISSSSEMCSGDMRMLEALPAGGTFSLLSGPGMVNGNLLTVVGSGEILVVYTLMENGCVGTVQQSIPVSSISAVTVVLVDDHILQAIQDIGSYQWVDCENQYAAIEGEQMNTFIVINSGSYALIQTVGPCVDTSECVQVEITSTLNEVRDEIRIYPNPASDIVVISNRSGENIKAVDIYDEIGNLIRVDKTIESGQIALDINSLISGFYIVCISTDDFRISYKLVKM